MNKALLYCAAGIVTGMLLTLTLAIVVGQILVPWQSGIPQSWSLEERISFLEDSEARLREYSGEDLEALGTIFGMLLVGYVFFKRRTRDRDVVHVWPYSY